MIDDGWEPIDGTRDDDDDEHPAGRRPEQACVTSRWPRSRSSGPGRRPTEEIDVRLPRLARHQITLPDGHTVGVAVCGRGVPLVVVHGFSAEGILYAQTLSRLVDLGFKVIAVDTAGHGGTLGLPTGAQTMASYAELLGRVLDHLGIERAVLAGHSMGGRLVTELAAAQPERAIGVDPARRDRRRHVGPHGEPVPGVPAAAGRDRRAPSWSTPMTTVPWFRDPRQAVKLGRLVGTHDHAATSPPVAAPRPGGVDPAQPRQPTDAGAAPRGAVPGVRRSTAAGTSPCRCRPPRTPPVVPRGDLVVVRGASHSWLLIEITCGLLFAVGLLTPFAAAGMIAVMVVAGW